MASEPESPAPTAETSKPETTAPTAPKTSTELFVESARDVEVTATEDTPATHFPHEPTPAPDIEKLLNKMSYQSYHKLATAKGLSVQDSRTDERQFG
jgi:hypothetical protein